MLPRIKSTRIAANIVACVITTGVSVGWSQTIDPHEIDIDSLRTDVEIKLVEEHFAKVAEVRSLLANCKRCFRYIVNSELRQLHDSAKLTRTEFLAIEQALRLQARKTSLEACQNRLMRLQLQRAGWTAGSQLDQDAPITIIEDHLLAFGQKELGESRCQRYRTEVNARRRYRQDAVINALIASLDSRVLLSERQRETIANVLHKEWQDVWLLSVRQLLSRGIESMPALPKRDIRKLLATPQQSLFDSMTWKPSAAPSIGPVELTQLGYEQKDVVLAEVLKFAPERSTTP